MAVVDGGLRMDLPGHGFRCDDSTLFYGACSEPCSDEAGPGSDERRASSYDRSDHFRSHHPIVLRKG